MKFVIQVDRLGMPVTEDGYALFRRYSVQSEDGDPDFGVCAETLESLDSPIGSFRDKDFCPVGTVEFVHKYLGYDPKPLVLFDKLPSEFVGRQIFTGTRAEFLEALREGGPLFNSVFSSQAFVKDIDTVKSSFSPWVMPIDQIRISSSIKEGTRYLFSEVVDFQCEWRVWCLGGRCVGLRPYIMPSHENGALPYHTLQVPGGELLRRWAVQLEELYGDTPVSFDIGLVRKRLEDGTRVVTTREHNTFWSNEVHYATSDSPFFSESWQLIETHPCYSLGLYGFDDVHRLAIMLWRTWLHLRKGATF